MEKQFFVQKLNHDGTPLGDPRPLYPERGQRMASHNVTPEGVDAVAAALGMERVEPPEDLSGLPPEEQLAEGLRRLAEQ